MTSKYIYCVFLQLWLLPGFTATSLPNVAPNGIATQSTTHQNAVASKAIDGNRNPEYSAGSCTHTLYNDSSQWWSLLLPDVYKITSVSVTNRNYGPTRFDGGKILIGNSPENNGNNNPCCAVIMSVPSGGTRSFDCGGMVGRMVNVYLVKHQALLTLCELEVYGELASPSPFYGGEVMGRSIAVVERKLCWSDALFYCRDYYWDLLSVRSEEEQREVEAVLRTVSFPLTKHLWLGLRRYLMDSMWFWMPGDSSNYSHWEAKTVWENTSPCGVIDTSGLYYWRDLPCGDHVYFICLTDFQADNQRVTFYSSTRP